MSINQYYPTPTDPRPHPHSCSVSSFSSAFAWTAFTLSCCRTATESNVMGVVVGGVANATGVVAAAAGATTTAAVGSP